jgi:hypothetical protein
MTSVHVPVAQNSGPAKEGAPRAPLIALTGQVPRDRENARENMSGKNLYALIAIVLALLAGAAAISWHLARADLRSYAVDDTLQPVAVLLEDNQKIAASLVHEDGVASESAILSTYLERIRKDGVPKSSAMKQKIDRLTNNNTTIVALLSRYLPHARSAALRVAAGQFADYASGFRDRWQSVFEIFMTGGNLPLQGPVPPGSILTLVHEEIERIS